MKNQKGITLVALIITIIVMLILVSVTVAVVINSNLINTADEAGQTFQNHYTNEGEMSEMINYNGNLVNISEQWPAEPAVEEGT